MSDVQDVSMNRLKTREELADYLHCDVRTIDREVKRGRLKRVFVGRGVRFTPEDINEYVSCRGDK